jgi:MFS family permease
MAGNDNLYVFFGLFFLYGVYAAATEGISKAWISNISDKKDVATAIGTYSAFQSLCTMVASAMAGFIWFQFGASAIFILTGIATICVIIYLFLNVKNSIPAD